MYAKEVTMQEDIEYKGFMAIIKYNRRKQKFTARANGFKNWRIYAEADDCSSLVKEFEYVVDSYIHKNKQTKRTRNWLENIYLK